MPVNIRDADLNVVSVLTATHEGSQAQQFAWAKSSRSDTYTGAANGTTVNVSGLGMSKCALQVKGTGSAPSAWVIVLEGSLNGTNFTTIITHSSAAGDADGSVKYLPGGAHYPFLYFRSRCVSITLGTAANAVATIVAMP